jgi:hypothetical protein
MILNDENFYDYAYKLFYGFSNTKPEQVSLTFSKQIVHPILTIKSSVHMIMPLPKKIGDDYVFEGMLFPSTERGRKTLWAIFLASMYHLSGHAAVSDYSIYSTWKKNKAEDLCWLAIDFIEDIRVQRYIEQSDPSVWKNLREIESNLETHLKKINKNKQDSKDSKAYHKEEDDKIIESIRAKIVDSKDDNKKELSDIANFLYANRSLLDFPSLPNHDQHVPKWLLKFEKRSPTFNYFGIMEEQMIRLDSLWQSNELAKTRLLKRYQKHMKNLHFDTIVIPSGNLQKFSQLKLTILPMLRRIRQQIRMVTNLMDDPKIDQIGYVDMQMAIQALASEGQSTDIFERDELRRGEEAWVILVDKSASMNLRLQELKEFVICMAESANELTGKQDAWALYSFDNNFHILKDFKERYSKEIQARIGALENGGLSLLPDALELTNRILNEDPRERKYIFVITDGHPSGYERIQDAFSKTVRKTDVSDTTLVAIGISKGITRIFRNNVRGRDLKTLVSKFITAYKTASSSD